MNRHEGSSLTPSARLAGAAAAAVAYALLAASPIVAEPPASPPGLARAYIDPELARQLELPVPAGGVAVRVVLRHNDLAGLGSARRDAVRKRQQRVLDALPAGAFTLKYRHTSLAGFSGWVHGAAFEALAQHPEVISVFADGEMRATLADGVPLTGADIVQAAGFTGQGINVAVVDTGIDTDHGDLMDDLVWEHCACDAHPSPNFGACCPGGVFEADGTGSAEDDNGHGTNVSGIITSANATNSGVAPDAGIIAVKVLSSGGGGQESGIDAGLDWILTNFATYNIRIVNMSLGDGAEHDDPSVADCSTDPTSVAIAALHSAGVTVFVASGNDGHDDGLAAPACTAEAISVGGVYDAVLGPIGWCGNRVCNQALCVDNTAPDVFVCHSNSDEILDLLAPNFQTSTTDMGGGTLPDFGGTSAASPYAAGQAALLLQASPGLTPEQLRSLMKSHGPLVTNPDNGLAFRRTDVSTALDDVLCGNGSLDAGEDCDPTAGAGECCAVDCTLLPSSTSCNDSSLCTESDVCDDAGSCAGVAVTCDDGNDCTTDTCDTLSGCVFANNSNPCEDGDACTAADACAGGVCQAGAPVTCEDGNVCTDDTCSATSGCIFTANTAPCEDGNTCTTDDICSSEICTAGPALDCDDGDACTAESCDEILGCAHDPIPGCGASVPATSGWTRLLLVLLVLAGAAAVLGQRRRVSD